MGLQAVSSGQCKDYLKAVLMMMKGGGSPVSRVSVGMARVLGTAVGFASGRCSAVSSVIVSRGAASLHLLPG